MSYLISIKKEDKLHVSNKDWHESRLKSSEIPISDYTSRDLNSIPTPYARMHAFQTAFEIVNREGPSSHDGETIYHQLVSDCLDVFEILFNYNQINNGG